jgi:tRNA threonylcarbamoyladenosine biosynthesis protein TsaB
VRLLAIETATAQTAVALGDDETMAEEVVAAPGRHTESLAPTIERLLAARGWTPRDLDGVVVDVGPGLFTGLRVGIATAKGLAVATGAALHAVSSTDVLAQAAFDAGIDGHVVCVVDARRREVFAAGYELDELGVREVAAVAVLDPATLAASLAVLDADRGVVLVGDGATRHRDVLEGDGRVVRDDVAVPSARSAIRLTRFRLARGVAPLAHAEVHPWYLREADAVANFQVRGPA